MFKKLVNIASYILSFLALVYLVQLFRKLNISAYNISCFPLIWFIPLFLTVYLGLFVLTSVRWGLILEFISAQKVGIGEAFPLITKSNIAKYLPSNVLQYAARNFLGIKLGWKHTDIAFSSLIEIVLELVIFGIAFVSILASHILTLPVTMLLQIERLKFFILFVFSVMCVTAIIVAILFRNHEFIKRLHLKAQTISLSAFLKLFAKMLIITLSFFVIGGLVLVAIYKVSFGLTFGLKDAFYIISVFTISYFAGYIVPGAPGGIGIREYFLVVMLGPSYGETPTLVSAIINRIILILVDVIAFIVGLCVEHRHNTTKQKGNLE
jgi:hypothetical protein